MLGFIPKLRSDHFLSDRVPYCRVLVILRYVLVFCIITGVISPAFAVDSQQIVTLTNKTGGDVEIKDIAVAPDNTFYIAGITFGPIAEEKSSKSGDAFIAKYTASGERMWLRTIANSERDEAEKIVIDKNGGVYISGTTGDRPNIFVSKYNRNGLLEWSKTSGIEPLSYGRGVTIDSDGSIYVGGFITEISSYGQLVGGIRRDENCLLIKYDQEGNMIWQKAWGGKRGIRYGDPTSDDHANAVLASDNGVYVGGSIEDDDIRGAFLAEFDKKGNEKWNHPLLFGGKRATVLSIAVAPNGLILATGFVQNEEHPSNPTQGSLDTFVASIEPGSGSTSIWVSKKPGRDVGVAIAANSGGGVYVAVSEDGGGYLSLHGKIGTESPKTLWETSASPTALAISKDGVVFISQRHPDRSQFLTVYRKSSVVAIQPTGTKGN